MGKGSETRDMYIRLNSNFAPDSRKGGSKDSKLIWNLHGSVVGRINTTKRKVLV
jgi:hypothetical protein